MEQSDETHQYLTEIEKAYYEEDNAIRVLQQALQKVHEAAQSLTASRQDLIQCMNHALTDSISCIRDPSYSPDPNLNCPRCLIAFEGKFCMDCGHRKPDVTPQALIIALDKNRTALRDLAKQLDSGLVPHFGEGIVGTKDDVTLQQLMQERIRIKEKAQRKAERQELARLEERNKEEQRIFEEQRKLEQQQLDEEHRLRGEQKLEEERKWKQVEESLEQERFKEEEIRKETQRQLEEQKKEEHRQQLEDRRQEEENMKQEKEIRLREEERAREESIRQEESKLDEARRFGMEETARRLEQLQQQQQHEISFATLPCGSETPELVGHATMSGSSTKYELDSTVIAVESQFNDDTSETITAAIVISTKDEHDCAVIVLTESQANDSTIAATVTSIVAVESQINYSTATATSAIVPTETPVNATTAAVAIALGQELSPRSGLRSNKKYESLTIQKVASLFDELDDMLAVNSILAEETPLCKGSSSKTALQSKNIIASSSKMDESAAMSNLLSFLSEPDPVIVPIVMPSSPRAGLILNLPSSATTILPQAETTRVTTNSNRLLPSIPQIPPTVIPETLAPLEKDHAYCTSVCKRSISVHLKFCPYCGGKNESYNAEMAPLVSSLPRLRPLQSQAIANFNNTLSNENNGKQATSDNVSATGEKHKEKTESNSPTKDQSLPNSASVSPTTPLSPRLGLGKSSLALRLQPGRQPITGLFQPKNAMRPPKEVVCFKCGESYPDDNRFCTACGFEALDHRHMSPRSPRPGQVNALTLSLSANSLVGEVSPEEGKTVTVENLVVTDSTYVTVQKSNSTAALSNTQPQTLSLLPSISSTAMQTSTSRSNLTLSGSSVPSRSAQPKSSSQRNLSLSTSSLTQAPYQATPYQATPYQATPYHSTNPNQPLVPLMTSPKSNLTPLSTTNSPLKESSTPPQALSSSNPPSTLQVPIDQPNNSSPRSNSVGQSKKPLPLPPPKPYSLSNSASTSPTQPIQEQQATVEKPTDRSDKPVEFSTMPLRLSTRVGIASQPGRVPVGRSSNVSPISSNGSFTPNDTT